MFRRQSAVRTKGKVKRRITDPNKRMLIGQIFIGIILFSVVGLIATALWYGTRIERLTLDTVTVEGGETINHEAVITAVASKLEGLYLGIIPRRFAWWYPEKEMYEALQQIPRMKDPVITRESGKELHVAFMEYVPYALWCEEREGDECLMVDETGYAFGPAPKLKGGAFIRYRTLGTEPKVGSTIAKQSDLATMESFIKLVRQDGEFEIAAVEIDLAGDVFYIVSGGGEFKAALRDDATQVYDNLRTILQSKEFSGIKPGNFQYIDLRFGTKVFVNDQPPGVASTTASSTEEIPLLPASMSTSM